MITELADQYHCITRPSIQYPVLPPTSMDTRADALLSGILHPCRIYTRTDPLFSRMNRSTKFVQTIPLKLPTVVSPLNISDRDDDDDLDTDQCPTPVSDTRHFSEHNTIDLTLRRSPR